jgi:hypothetical protein
VNTGVAQIFLALQIPEEKRMPVAILFSVQSITLPAYLFLYLLRIFILQMNNTDNKRSISSSDFYSLLVEWDIRSADPNVLVALLTSAFRVVSYHRLLARNIHLVSRLFKDALDAYILAQNGRAIIID